MPARKDEARRAKRGSQLQTQIYVNRRRGELDKAVLGALPDLAEQAVELRWVSPLEADGFREYQDTAFLRAVGLEELATELTRFWPTGGPVWDGLAIAELASGETGVVLAEAKSYPEEMYSGGSAAGRTGSERGLANRQQILDAIAATQRWIEADAIDPGRWIGPLDETRPSSSLYQTANRLAHLYWLREVVDRPAWLVHVLFVNDPTNRPTSREDWEHALRWADARLGLHEASPYAGHAFLSGREASEL
jgi:hypothetical protein